MGNSISEKIIEDILTSDKAILSDVLSLNHSDLNLIARQKIVSSGKLDMLYLYKDELLLIEIKVVSFYNDIIQQINGYEADLFELQNHNRLINARIRKIVLVTSARDIHFKVCIKNGIQLSLYKPEDVLNKYYENFRELSSFLKVQSGDYGVVRLGLLKSTLTYLSEGLTIREIGKIEGKSDKTIHNRISVAKLLNLVSKFKNIISLTELGSEFVSLGKVEIDDRLNEAQIELLLGFVIQSPFYSSITYSIFSLIESVFVLSKNSYPVAKKDVLDYFVKSVGKTATWRANKSRETATYIFSNYCCELRFLSMINGEYYITPKGIQAVLLLQLNRSIKLIESGKA